MVIGSVRSRAGISRWDVMSLTADLVLGACFDAFGVPRLLWCHGALAEVRGLSPFIWRRGVEDASRPFIADALSYGRKALADVAGGHAWIDVPKIFFTYHRQRLSADSLVLEQIARGARYAHRNEVAFRFVNGPMRDWFAYHVSGRADCPWVTRWARHARVLVGALVVPPVSNDDGGAVVLILSVLQFWLDVN